jgi:hypothetical protein
MKLDGFSTVWENAAVAYEYIPENRLTKQWLLNRARRIGNNNVRVQQLRQPGTVHKAVRVAKTLGLYASGYASLLTSRADEGRQLRARMKMESAYGKMLAHLNRPETRAYDYTDGN